MGGKLFSLGVKNKMKIYHTLKFTHEGVTKDIIFGSPETKEEFEKMYSLRFDVYAKKDYFKDGFEGFKEKSDQDSLDLSGKCLYVIALVDDGRVLGAVRLIRDSVLPTEKIFKFETPAAIQEIPPEQRGEIGRLVVERYSGESFFPRNLVLLFLLKTLLEVGREVGVVGGYSFVKKTLLDKLNKIKVPVHLIKNYVQDYPADGVLFNYFNQAENPVSPIYFLRKDVEGYFEDFLGAKSKIVHRDMDEKTYILNDSFYTKFLKQMNVL